MAIERQKYPSSSVEKQEYPAGTVDLSNIPANPKLNPKLLPDGTVEVHNLKERDSDGLSYHLDEKTDQFYLTKSLDANTECRYIPKNIDKVYQTTVTYKSEVKNAYAVFKNEVKRFAVKSMDRYKKSPKALKKKIDTILKDKNQYFFTESRGGESRWNQAYKDVTTLGPYNYDTKLKVTKDIDFINDLIVIKTGQNSYDVHEQGGQVYSAYSPNTWGIAWVSPHDLLAYQGSAVYSLTGTLRYQKDVDLTGSGAEYLSGVLSYDKHYYVTNAGHCYALSSKNYRIPSGQYLDTTDMNYYDLDGVRRYMNPPLEDQFYYIYEEHQPVMNTGGWDGVLPSGTWCNIETWSLNPKYIGFDGEITIAPTGEDAPTVDFTGSCTGTASDLDYQQSVRKAVKQAKKKFYKKLKSALVKAGIKNTTARMNKYEALLVRVAQNAYDGLSMVRNVQIAKVQGLESNPLGGPIYYDGTIQQYGGTQMTPFYNTEQTFLERTSATGNRGGTGSSSSGGEGATY